MQRQAFVFLATVLVITPALALTPRQELYKQLAGPADEFKQHLMPDPRATPVEASSILLEANLETTRNSDRSSWSAEFPVDSGSDFLTVSLFHELKDQIEIRVVDPTGVEVEATRVDEKLAWGADAFPTTSMGIPTPKTGVWTVTLSAPAVLSKRAMILIGSHSDNVVSSALTTNKLVIGQAIGVDVVAMANGSNPVRGAISSAELEVRTPKNELIDAVMHDDGENDDGAADDGVYAALFNATEVGQYQVNVTTHGIDPAGHKFTRTVFHTVRVVEEGFELTGHADARITDTMTSLRIDLEVSRPANSPSSPRYRAYAEVYATKAGTSDLIPVCWIGGMTDVQEDKFASVFLNMEWLRRAGAEAPIELRNVYLQELNSYVPVSEVTTVKVTIPGSDAERLPSLLALPFDGEITKEMREGPRPLNVSTPKFAESKLLLVHGYCVTESPYSFDSFTDYAVFEDFDQSRTVDDFAQVVQAFGDQYASYGIVGHSQGGLASTHLAASYHSNLDLAKGGRLVQSLASPYQGVPLSGLIAAIGDLLGIGCGMNDDLTYDGAARWQAGIPADVRSKVYTYYAKYKSSGLINSCVLAANAVLSWPNDGLVEVDKAPLEGANDLGLVDGECHSVNMNHPPICKNNDRNKELNAQASR